MKIPNEAKVGIGEEEFYLIEFPIGDYSGDGHGKCNYYIVKSKKSFQEVREVHFKARKKLGFDIGDICKDYNDNGLDEKISDKLRGWGYDFNSFDGVIDKRGIPKWLSSDDVVNIWLYLLNHIDSSLKLELMKIPTMYGKDDKNRNLYIPGYGVFD